MNSRRSFLQLLGLAPVAVAVAPEVVKAVAAPDAHAQEWGDTITFTTPLSEESQHGSGVTDYDEDFRLNENYEHYGVTHAEWRDFWSRRVYDDV